MRLLLIATLLVAPLAAQTPKAPSLAARVQRRFHTPEGALIAKEVNGSFYEFITRLPLPEEDGKQKLDLSFDSSNAQAIFKMTANSKA